MAKDRWTAIAFALFIGGLGIHRFYLRQAKLGLLYLLFCWSFIPAIIAWVDAVVWITKGEEFFDEKYNGYVGRKR